MRNRHATSSPDRVNQSSIVPWAWLDRKTGTAFVTAGVLLLASAVVPLGLKAVTAWAWVSGLLLVGLGVLAGVTGLFGLYPTLDSHGSWLPALGVLGGVVAGLAALGLIVLAGIALIGEGALGMDFGKPIGSFVVVTLSMPGGFAIGSLSAGTVGLRSGAIPRSTSLLLLVGGGSLLVPVVSEALRRGMGIEPGIPPWILFPVLALLVLDLLAIGFTLRGDT